MPLLGWLLVLTGCASQRFQDRQREICDPEYGCADRPWWPDADGDGWGDPSSPAEWGGDAPAGLVNNALDCDDSDADVTANIAGLCPAEFGDVEAVTGGVDQADFGAGPEPAEWIVVELSAGVRVYEAEDLCELGWGGRVGGPQAPLTALAGVWISGQDGVAHPSWADDEPVGPSIWTGTEVVTAMPLDVAAPSCIRPEPDPSAWPTWEEPL